MYILFQLYFFYILFLMWYLFYLYYTYKLNKLTHNRTSKRICNYMGQQYLLNKRTHPFSQILLTCIFVHMGEQYPLVWLLLIFSFRYLCLDDYSNQAGHQIQDYRIKGLASQWFLHLFIELLILWKIETIITKMRMVLYYPQIFMFYKKKSYVLVFKKLYYRVFFWVKS